MLIHVFKFNRLLPDGQGRHTAIPDSGFNASAPEELQRDPVWDDSGDPGVQAHAGPKALHRFLSG